jgi:hypothetical protein
MVIRISWIHLRARKVYPQQSQKPHLEHLHQQHPHQRLQQAASQLLQLIPPLKQSETVALFGRATATGLTSAGAPATPQGCSTTCYSTLTGCSITGTTTITIQSSSTRQPCAYTCSACGAANIPRDAAAVTAKTLTSSAALKAGVLPMPQQYPNGLPQLLQAAYTDPNTTWVSRRGNPTTEGLSSALKHKFGKEPFNIGVKNLIGCTSVAVVSRRGIASRLTYS